MRKGVAIFAVLGLTLALVLLLNQPGKSRCEKEFEGMTSHEAFDMLVDKELQGQTDRECEAFWHEYYGIDSSPKN